MFSSLSLNLPRHRDCPLGLHVHSFCALCTHFQSSTLHQNKRVRARALASSPIHNSLPTNTPPFLFFFPPSPSQFLTLHHEPVLEDFKENMVSLLFLLLVPALIGVAIYGVSLLFSHPSPKAPIAIQSPNLVITRLHSLAPPTTLPEVFSLVPTPSPLPELPKKKSQTPFLVGHPVVVADSGQDHKEKPNDPVKPDKTDSKHGADEDDDDDGDDGDDDDDDGEGDDEDTKHKDGNPDSQTRKSHAMEQGKKGTVDKPAAVETEKKKLADMSETSGLVRGIAEGGILTGEEETIDQSIENGESNLATFKDKADENDSDEENKEDTIDEENERNNIDEEDEEDNTDELDEKDNTDEVDEEHNTDEEDDINSE